MNIDGSRPPNTRLSGHLRLQALPNPEPKVASPARTAFRGKAVESHPNSLDVEIALQIDSGVVSDRGCFRAFRASLFQALEHNVAKRTL
jgi:hypothetical protein